MLQDFPKRVAHYVKASVGAFANFPKLPSVNPSNPLHIAPKGYVDTSLNTTSTNIINMFQYVPKRHTVQRGKVDANNRANFISAGTGLQAILSATSDPFTATIADGWNSQGAINYPINVTTDQQFNSLTASSANLLHITRIAPSGSLVFGATVNEPVYSETPPTDGTAFLNHFDGSNGATSSSDVIPGVTWTFGGTAALTTSIFKYGSASLGGLDYVNSTANFVRTTNTYPTGSKWTLEFYVRFKTLNAGENQHICAGAANFQFDIWLEGSTNKICLNLSNNGSSNNILSGGAGTKTNYVINTQYHIALEYDSVTGYKLYVDGVQDQSQATTTAIAATGVTFGGRPTTAGANIGFRGYIDEPRLTLGRNVYGAAFTPPSSAFSIQSYDWFDINQMKMKTGNVVAGWTAIQRIYIGEAITDGSGVTSVKSYAFNGRFLSDIVAVSGGTNYSIVDNIGCPLKRIDATRRETSALKWAQMARYGSNGGVMGITDRNTVKAFMATNIGSSTAGTDDTDAFSSASATTGQIQVLVERAF